MSLFFLFNVVSSIVFQCKCSFPPTHISWFLNKLDLYYKLSHGCHLSACSAYCLKFKMWDVIFWDNSDIWNTHTLYIYVCVCLFGQQCFIYASLVKDQWQSFIKDFLIYFFYIPNHSHGFWYIFEYKLSNVWLLLAFISYYHSSFSNITLLCL